MWDVCRGRDLPEEDKVDMYDLQGLDMLGDSLREAQWRFSTRVSYNRWFKTWQSFASAVGCVVLPAEELWLKRFFTYLTLHYAASTVRICASAISAIHKLNNVRDPISVTLQGVLKAIEAVGVCGTRSKKFIVDAAFIVSMCASFVEDYPVFDASLFDPASNPTVDSDRSIMWLRGVAMILLGLEVGARASEVANMTVCCWKKREDQSVFVSVQLAKNGKNGEVAGAVLVPGEGAFEKNCSAISFFEEYYLPFLQSQGLGVSSRCVARQFRTTICPACSPMFPAWPKKGSKKDVQCVSVSQVTSAVKKWASKIGRDAANYSAISFRRGSVSIAAAAKVDRNIRKKHCRWKGEFTQDIYTEVSSSEAKEFGTALRSAVVKAKKAKGRRVSFEFNV